VNRQIRVGDSKYGTLTTYFDPLSALSPKSQNFALHIVVFRSKHTVPVIIDAHCAKHFLHNLGTREVAFQGQINGVSARGACKNLGPLFISATVEANNFKFDIKLGLGE